MFKALNVMAKLLAMDLYVFRTSFIDKCINSLVYCLAQLFVMGYIMQSFGLQDDYTSFFVVGLFATSGMFEIFPMVAKITADRMGDQTILYYCTLPTTSYLVFLRIILFSAFGSLALMLFFFPFMATILWFQGILFEISFIAVLILLLLIALFYGSFTLLLATFVPNMTKISNIWMRFQFPLWFLGCYQFSFESLVEKTSYFGYLALLNPFTYINEGMRAVCLHGHYLHWGICAGMLTVFVILFSYFGILRFKKQLDVI